MTLDEAIKRLQNLAIHHRDITFHEDENAIMLSIEALKAWRDRRLFSSRASHNLLPGETEKEKRR